MQRLLTVGMAASPLLSQIILRLAITPVGAASCRELAGPCADASPQDAAPMGEFACGIN